MAAERHRRLVERMIRNPRVDMHPALVVAPMMKIAIMRQLRILPAHPHIVVRRPRPLKRS